MNNDARLLLLDSSLADNGDACGNDAIYDALIKGKLEQVLSLPVAIEILGAPLTASLRVDVGE
jgi:hypothetical protein